MAFIFRLHPNGPNTNTDWLSSQSYGSNVISQIEAPNGASAQTEITSIPSPFARIALVKSAFGEVVKSKNLSGNTIYHKMVSDSLDVAEIFFNYDKLKSKFKIVVWDIKNDLASLKNTHPQIYDSLDVFLKQDAPVYNFDSMNRLYILVYIGKQKKTQMDVVGATSPASMFFTPANNLSYISNDISFGQDHPFDGQFQPLFKRDPKFVEYLFTFRKDYGQQFASDFPEVNDYLDNTYSELSGRLKNIIVNIQPTALSNYNVLSINASNTVDILGKPYHTKPLQPVRNSDFTIAQSHYSQGELPLVLPVEKGNQYANLFYVTDKWGSQNAAPYCDNTPWQNRTLPNDGTPHPYLTIDDFLEDTVLVYPRKANTDKFFFGNWDNASEKSVFLPLKPLFFEFFTVDQLIHGINGSPMIKMTTLNKGDVSVELTIPIHRGSITYTKNYFQNNVPDSNRGAVEVVNTSFGLSMLPMVRTNNPFYRIAIAHAFNDTKKYQIETYLQGGKNPNIQEIIRNKTDNAYLKTHIFTNDASPIDCIRIGIGGNYGMVIPFFNVAQRNRSFVFAVDFGTTNTHIEYTDGTIQPITFKDSQLTFWADYDTITEQTFEADLSPVEIGKKFAFPTRTALSEASYTDWQQPVVPMAQTNIPLVYGHRLTFDYNTINTDLKWSNAPINIRRVESYIDNLMLLMRNKVLLEGGQLNNTKIIWFYPGSMTTARRNAYQTVWNNTYQKYFGGVAGNICSTLESIAPYEYFRRQTPAASRMVSIDIGGGTTDVVIAERGSILYTTSFRFAANTIFGDGYTQNGALNGLVAHYVNDIRELLGRNSLNELQNILDSLKASGLSTDLASFFFSMKNDDEAIRKNASHLLDWNEMLQKDDDFKVVFLLFYTAIIYHIAHIMHAQNLQPPRHIAFSGNGARVVSVLSSNTGTLADYTKDIFCRVYKISQYDANGLDIILTDSPKVATCKGGLSIVQTGNVNIAIGSKLILKNTASETFYDSTIDNYQTIGHDEKNSTIKDVRDFLQFTLKNKSSFSIKDQFGIAQSALEEAMSVCDRDLDTFYDNGLERKLQENASTDPIEETLFFYPIIGMLHELCNYINTKE